MKKKIIRTLMVMSLSVMMFGCSTNSEAEKNTDSSNQVEETPAPTSTSTPTPTSTPTSTPTPAPTETPTPTPTEVPVVEEQTSFKDDIEGKYWVEAYDSLFGYYFDGTKVIQKGNGWESEYYYMLQPNKELGEDYSQYDGWVDIGYDSYLYRLRDGILSLVMPAEGGDSFREVDKEEFDSLFATTTVETSFEDDIEGKYWVEAYDSYFGYYFDGTKVIQKGNGWENEYSYSLQPDKELGEDYSQYDGWVKIEGESYLYKLRNGILSLGMPAEGMDSFREVDKEEFDSCFADEVLIGGMGGE